MNMTQTWLHDCLAQFPEISAQQFGCVPDLHAIERESEPLRTQRVSVERILTHFRKCAGKESWFRTYWLFPSIADLSDEEKNISFNLHQLSKGNEGTRKEKDAIKDLLKAFRQIELVSIILRFIRPDSFGMLTPPIASILDLHSGRDAVETYLNYLRNLRAIRDHYKFSTAAEADMALWVLDYMCNTDGGDSRKIKQAFETDEFVLQLRAKNLVEPLARLSSARLANALEGVDNHLAALVGCYALEANVKKWARAEGVEDEAVHLAQASAPKDKHPRPSLKHYAEALSNNEKATSLKQVRQMLGYLHDIRNKVFHAEVKEPKQHEVRKLVEAVLKIEQHLKKQF